MSTNSQTHAAPETTADAAATLFSFWTQWMEQSARGTQAMLEAMHSVGDTQKIQRNVLDPIATSIEEFMRTPVFLEAMKRNLKVVTDLKRLQDQVLKDSARQVGAPMAADITGLFDRLHSTEETIIARLKAIEDRLKAIEDRVVHSPPSPGTRRSSSRAADEAAST